MNVKTLKNQLTEKNAILLDLKKAQSVIDRFCIKLDINELIPVYEAEISLIGTQIKEIQEDCPHTETKYFGTNHREHVYMCINCEKTIT